MTTNLSRRSFLAVTAAAPLVPAWPRRRTSPSGSSSTPSANELAKDLNGTVTAVAKMGYKVVEFYSPYFELDPRQAKDVRKLMDGLGIRCNSTHNGMNAFKGDGIAKAIELNKILGREVHRAGERRAGERERRLEDRRRHG